MFKVTGIIFIFLSSVALFAGRSIKDLSTYNFLMQTIDIARQLKAGCNSNKTYNQIFEAIHPEQYSYYKNFTYHNRENNLSGKLLDVSRVGQVDNFFIHLGEKNRYSELEYIQQNIDNFDFMAKKFKENYDKNKQINYICGISIGLIISIVII